MKIALVLPRKFQFSAAGATAIDSCARDYAGASRFRADLTVHGSPVAAPFPGLDFRPVAAEGKRAYRAELIARFKDLRPDVILVEQRVDLASQLARGLGPIPVVVRRHGRTEAHSRFKRWRHARELRPIARFIWVSRFSAESFLADYPDMAARVRIVGNGIDTDLWTPAADKHRVVAFAGRAAEEKGLALFCDAVVLALRSRPDWTAAVCTTIRSADERAYADAGRAALAGLGGRVRWSENATREDVRALFAVAAIVVIPSIVPEGFPLAAVEAMASGAALVHCGLGGLPEVAGDAGVVPDALIAAGYAATIGQLIDDPGTRGRLANAARARAEAQFRMSGVAAQIDGLLESLARRA